jgi:hypothetical protein
MYLNFLLKRMVFEIVLNKEIQVLKKMNLHL